jgi:DNA repair photolyase
MERGKDRFAYMSSIITYDENVSKIIEAGTPTPQRRMETLKAL